MPFSVCDIYNFGNNTILIIRYRIKIDKKILYFFINISKNLTLQLVNNIIRLELNHIRLKGLYNYVYKTF